MSQIELQSPTTGIVWRILKMPGDRVEAGEELMIIESMKMEIPVACETAATIVDVVVREGDEVVENQVVAVAERA